MISADINVNSSAREAVLPLASEADFYNEYLWCLNPFLTIPEAAELVRRELARIGKMDAEWQEGEVRLNVCLLACLISDTIDDYLLGGKYDFSQATNVFGPSRLVVRPLGRVMNVAAQMRDSRLRGLADWRDEWENAVAPFAGPSPDPGPAAAGRLLALLAYRFPKDLLTLRARIPAAFRSQDLTHFDVYRLGEKFMEAFPDRARPVQVVGLRTAGSYFAPLLRGFLESAGYRNVSAVTLRPKHGLGFRERRCLENTVRRGAVAAIIDEPVYSSSTVSRGIDCLNEAGFKSENIAALFPVHPQRREWCVGEARLGLAGIRVITLPPEEWYKSSQFELDEMWARLNDYFGPADIRVRIPERLAEDIWSRQEPGFHCRLKQVYEVDVPGATPRRRRIFAKSAGWGWLSYHAFLAASRLAPCVPGLLGLRHGILVTEWVEPDDQPEGRRSRFIDSASSYIAARVRMLSIPEDPAPSMARDRRHRGSEELAAVLSGAYSSKIAAALKRPRLEDELSQLVCHKPTLIDGKMRPEEWIDMGGRFVKIDFEHHGMGKHQLNMTDPAYDLAETILYWTLSEQEERDLVRSYIRQSGDEKVTERLFLCKLLAGTWAQARATDGLQDPAQSARHDVFNDRYITASRFLTVQTARFCASLAEKRPALRWTSPLAVLDVDGVIDKQVFGFPSSSMAGIEAISLLASHDVAVALNTARPAGEMKEYCQAYGFLGGSAEYGAFVWDRVTGRERVLVSDESSAQMEQLKRELRQLPGVFVHDGCQYSVRAYTYARGTTIPLPAMQVKTIMARLRLNRLQLHQTFTDSTITASETDKGNGLRALLELAGCTGFETMAVGDTEPDLAMFRVASRSFAPGHVSCPGPARRLGCYIATRSWQRGLLEIAQKITHPQGGSCSRCKKPAAATGPWNALFRKLLETSDRSSAKLMVNSMLDPLGIRAFLK